VAPSPRLPSPEQFIDQNGRQWMPNGVNPGKNRLRKKGKSAGNRHKTQIAATPRRQFPPPGKFRRQTGKGTVNCCKFRRPGPPAGYHPGNYICRTFFNAKARREQRNAEESSSPDG